ncbi:putative bifunctional diguanylate cyclase/phosphodiesterase [Methylophaga sulfidovorans]|uniref:Diguanylate cyclase (GGDEF) domain-containing protein n=1 Tax=Methylophaga sulfidovorans TaxID=45496 RepID=A0A1I3XI36_9GAMM|nr:EAL domain-containing protein [Methylophaga sulfidovorans]SFK19120.1 diguanylate cyclase (GGDEF) domain-containing protein [Methylophaga sulfidovorans]
MREIALDQKSDLPASIASVTELLDAKIIIGGRQPAETAFTKTLLEISGFKRIQSATDTDGVMLLLRQSIDNDLSDIDLLILDNDLPGISTKDIRMVMDQFDEWRLIPIISLCRQSIWDHAQLLTDLGHGVTSLLYHPMTAESLPPAIMTALAVKRERDKTFKRQTELEDELANLKVMEARLQFSVNHDDLTGLANRRRLENALDMTLSQVRNFMSVSALFYIDLDSFKVLNDAEGHEAGDTLLVQVANSLRRYFNINDILVRIGSDEFAVLVNNTNKETAIKLAEDLRNLFDGYDFEHHGHHYHLSASIGLKIIDADNATTVGEVLSHSNQACYTAKTRGRNRVHLYSPDDREMHTLRHSVEWAPRIRAALKEGLFLLEFQPIYSLEAEQVSHYECLIRMRGEGNVIFYPKEFIPVAEAMGLIHQIDFWVVAKVFELIVNMPENLSFAINLSGNVFLDENLYKLVRDKLSQTKIDPNRIVFEITETYAISNFEQTRRMVSDLRALGCRFALDDFGAGFNSYSYLKHFPVDILKIDGGFITDLDNDPVDQQLVKSMIDIAHSLGKKTVAEFVERKSTLELLKNYGVDMVQGFLVGKPSAKIPKPKD